MANSLNIFAFDSAALRVVRDEAGTPWFNAGDLCAVLGYSNARDAVANHVDEDDVAKHDAIDTIGRTQSVNHVNESGMYALIFGSTKPEAKKFKRWVTSEVLPALRQTGRYEAQGNDPTLPLDLVINATNAYANTIKALAKPMGARQAHVMANNQAKAMGLDLHQTWGLDPATLPEPARKPASPQAKLLRYIREAGPVATRQVILKRMHCTAAELDDLIDDAVANGLLLRKSGVEYNYAGTVYVLVGGAA
jgi:prophage antirepressor-like protein